MSTPPVLPSISTHNMATPQLQRAWCLMLVRLIWPTIQPGPALKLAQWLNNGQTGGDR